jgi:hypothetical protein
MFMNKYYIPLQNVSSSDYEEEIRVSFLSIYISFFTLLNVLPML